MKVLHLMLASFYIDNYSYQENLLPKYHKKMGYDVEIVASLFTFDENGKGKWLQNRSNYINENGIPVTRLEFKKSKYSRKIRRYEGLMDELARVNPEIIFIHGVQFSDIDIVVKYIKKHSNTVVYVDNHADFMNSGKNWISKHILHEIIWRHYAQKINPYVKRFYGVLPGRCDFLRDEYKIPEEKVELLVMGVDDEQVSRISSTNAPQKFREKNHIQRDDFLIVTGGKLDRKKNTIELISAVKQFPKNKVKLIIFGSVDPELQDTFYGLCDGVQVQYLGWMNTEQSYDAFSAADLVIFPGLHSVYWEQTAGLGIPMLVRKLPGVDHIDMGGNVRYLRSGMRDDIYNGIIDIVDHPEEYQKMKEKALEAQKTFSYKEIALRSLR